MKLCRLVSVIRNSGFTKRRGRIPNIDIDSRIPRTNNMENVMSKRMRIILVVVSLITLGAVSMCLSTRDRHFGGDPQAQPDSDKNGAGPQ